MRTFSTVLTALFFTSLHAQDREIPFIGYFGRDGIKTTLRVDSFGTLFIPNADTNAIIYLAKNYSIYQLYDRKNRLLSEGGLGGRIYADYFKKFGKWTAYEPGTGKPKVQGYFFADEPIGSWCYYFANGQIEKHFSIARVQFESFYYTCRVGLYEEYFENGSLKITGFYKVVIDSISQARYDTNLNKLADVRVMGPVSRKDGLWLFYKQNGDLERKEEHR
jgi:antitoxin component YwqK of YwqJK toxin-antitoxin module